MKELYIAPEVELVCLRADAQLASNSEVNFDHFFNNTGDDSAAAGEGPVKSDINTDIDLPLDLYL